MIANVNKYLNAHVKEVGTDWYSFCTYIFDFTIIWQIHTYPLNIEDNF